MKIKASELGKALRKIRGEDTLKGFGERIALSIAHVNSLERDEKPPSWNVMKRYAKVNGRNLVITFEGTDD